VNIERNCSLNRVFSESYNYKLHNDRKVLNQKKKLSRKEDLFRSASFIN